MAKKGRLPSDSIEEGTGTHILDEPFSGESHNVYFVSQCNHRDITAHNDVWYARRDAVQPATCMCGTRGHGGTQYSCDVSPRITMYAMRGDMVTRRVHTVPRVTCYMSPRIVHIFMRGDTVPRVAAPNNVWYARWHDTRCVTAHSIYRYARRHDTRCVTAHSIYRYAGRHDTRCVTAHSIYRYARRHDTRCVTAHSIYRYARRHDTRCVTAH